MLIKILEKQNSQSFKTLSNSYNISNQNIATNSSTTRSTRVVKPVNYNLNYNLNDIFNQAGLSNEAIRAAGKTSKPKTKIEKQNKESFNDESKQQNINESDINTENCNINNNNKNSEDDNIDETLSENNKISTKKKKNASDCKAITKKRNC